MDAFGYFQLLFWATGSGHLIDWTKLLTDNVNEEHEICAWGQHPILQTGHHCNEITRNFDVMIFFFSFLPFLYGRGLCPNANQPQPRTQFITSPGFPRGASRGGQCKYELKVNYGSFIKLEKITSNIKCIPGKGVTAVEMVNVQGEKLYVASFWPKPKQFSRQ